MLSIFSRKVHVRCPFCLDDIALAKDEMTCNGAGCGQELHPQYLIDYKNADPFFVPLVGWTQVGKSVYLLALTLLLDLLDRAWPEYFTFPLTPFTQATLQEARDAFENNRIPVATPMGVREAFIMQMKNIPEWGSRTLIHRDCAGENFRDFLFHPDQDRFIIGAKTIFFMISLPDLEGGGSQDGKKYSVDDLMVSYISTLQKRKIDLRRDRRNVVVILSKADKIPDLPAHLYDYLVKDPFWAAVARDATARVPGATAQPKPPDLPQYFEELRRASDAIREWLEWKGIGNKFIRLARDMKMQLEFSIVSSTGGDVDETNPQRLARQWQPFRVLDPFFLALDFETE